MTARFLQIKSAILEHIEQGELGVGQQVPSENQLAQLYGVSRMTARRALTELVDEGILLRSRGAGTFVSDARPMTSMLSIRSIDEEITQRGHRHHSDILAQQEVQADSQQASWLDVAAGDTLYLTRMVHYENDLAVQLEERLVNPALAPEYLNQNFSRQTASQYLCHIAPLTQADHIIEAISATPELAGLLAIPPSQPCLKVTRRTFSEKGIVSVASLIHPGNRYRIGGHLDFHSS